MESRSRPGEFDESRIKGGHRAPSNSGLSAAESEAKVPNLAELMKGRVEELMKAPKAPPIGDYPGVIKRFEPPVEFESKGVTYHKMRIWARLLDWPSEGIEESEKEGIDISRREVPCDYFLPVQRDFALLCHQCGITGELTEQTPYELIGKPVLVVLVREASKKNKDEVFAKASKLIGIS